MGRGGPILSASCGPPEELGCDAQILKAQRNDPVITRLYPHFVVTECECRVGVDRDGRPLDQLQRIVKSTNEPVTLVPDYRVGRGRLTKNLQGTTKKYVVTTALSFVQ